MMMNLTNLMKNLKKYKNTILVRDFKRYFVSIRQSRQEIDIGFDSILR